VTETERLSLESILRYSTDNASLKKALWQPCKDLTYNDVTTEKLTSSTFQSSSSSRSGSESGGGVTGFISAGRETVSGSGFFGLIVGIALLSISPTFYKQLLS